MKKLFEKHETKIIIILIVSYVVLNSYIMKNFGTSDYRSVVINTVFSIILLGLINILGRNSYYGLQMPKEYRKYLYFIPLLLIMLVNIWEGVHINNTRNVILFHILTMINVGFIEEIIFRGFLFKMMEKDSLKSAMVWSSITFGIGHIINLFNGAEFIPTLLQVVYAVTLGYLFVVIFYRSKSLLPAIITHIVVNSTSIFGVNNDALPYVSSLYLIIVSISYAFYINRSFKSKIISNSK